MEQDLRQRERECVCVELAEECIHSSIQEAESESRHRHGEKERN